MDKRNIRKWGLAIVAGYFIFHFIMLMISGRVLFDSKSYGEIRQEWSEIYLDLFKSDLEFVVIPTITSFSDRREPISYFNYQDYTIAVWELLTDKGMPIIIEEAALPGDKIPYAPYEEMNIPGIDTYITQDSLLRTDSVFIYLKGDVLEANQVNQRLRVYSLVLEEMTLSYKEDGPFLMAANPKFFSAAKRRPTKIAFYYKDYRNYVIVMFPVKEEYKNDVKLSNLFR